MHDGAGQTEKRLARLEALVQASLTPPDKSTTVGTPGSQSGASPSFTVLATTTNAAAVTVDTGYAPPDGHGADLDVHYNVTDRGAHTSRSGNGAGTMKNFAGFGGVAIAGAPIFGGANGDAGLATSVPSLSVSGGTLHVTVTPPAGYVGTLDWIVDLGVLEN